MSVDATATLSLEEAEISTPALSAIIYGKNACPRCTATTREFDRQGIPYEYINVEEDTAPRENLGGLSPFDHVVKTYGREMPVVVVTDDLGYDDWWSGVAMHKWLETRQRFTEAGLILPEGERVTS